MISKTTPNKVCILVSTYNWPEALELSIRSIFRQTVLPDEIVIADDGSKHDTSLLIDRLSKESTISIKHVWQEDNGFRKTIILNKAIAQISADYILQIDGDVILSPHFVSDHIDVAQRGCFVCGSRVKLSQEITSRILLSKKFRPNIFNLHNSSSLLIVCLCQKILPSIQFDSPKLYYCLFQIL